MMDMLLTGNMAAWFYAYMGYLWLIVAIVFLFAELNTPGLFFFVSFAIGSFCASVLAFSGYSIFVQCMVGLTVSLVVLFVMKAFLKRTNLSQVEYGSAMTNIDALAGRQGIVTKSIKLHEKGVVKVGGEHWSARAEGEGVLELGVVVRVLRVEGNTVVVKPVALEKQEV